MRSRTTDLDGIVVLRPTRHGDSRGYLAETYRDGWLPGVGPFVQENQSLSAEKGTVRGLHLQAPPRSQGKLVRVVQGAVLDVAVDVRIGSPTYGRHVAVRLDSVEMEQMWIPPGFAHGFCTLEPSTIVVYKLTDVYSPEHERSLLWSDPALGIEWPVAPGEARVSERDMRSPTLAQFQSPFRHEGS